MRGVWVFAIILLSLLAVPIVDAATIYGKVYDYGLRLAANSVVQINTLPPQQLVSANGSYSFNAIKGDYTLVALFNDVNGADVYYVEENISVLDNGSYVRDLILFPVTDLSELDIDPDIYDPVSLNGDSVALSSLLYPLAFVVAIIVLFLLLRPLFFKKKDVREPAAEGKPAPAVSDRAIAEDADADDLDKLLAFVRKHRRVTQKDIRKEFPLSEAKISLMITELEHDGKLRKIKKGRGNIILFVDK